MKNFKISTYFLFIALLAFIISVLLLLNAENDQRKYIAAAIMQIVSAIFVFLTIQFEKLEK